MGAGGGEGSGGEGSSTIYITCSRTTFWTVSELDIKDNYACEAMPDTTSDESNTSLKENYPSLACSS